MVGDPLPRLEAVQSIGVAIYFLLALFTLTCRYFPLVLLSINKKTIATNAATCTASATTV